MSTHNSGHEVLQIKKYPNRRYYDATRSRHVTLHDVHDLILAGKDVCITDSRTNEDITNLVLTQILLEKDQPKLDIFPTSVFHMMIRSNRQVLRGYVERFFAPMLGMMASSQKQFEQLMRSASGGAFMSPVEWTNQMMEFFGKAAGANGPGSSVPIPDPEWDRSNDADASERNPNASSAHSDGSAAEGRAQNHASGRSGGSTRRGSVDAGGDEDRPSSEPASIDELRAQAADLIRRIDELNPTSEENPAD